MGADGVTRAPRSESACRVCVRYRRCACRPAAAELGPGSVLLWGPLVTLSVISAGNHYIFDVLAGLAVTALGFVAASFRCGALGKGRPKVMSTLGEVGAP